MRDVLIALCGLTPQVITETLWALSHRTPPILPAEVWILTTKEGAKSCRARLLGTNGALARFVHEYRPDPTPRCPASQIIVLKGANGRPLSDVRSAQDNQAVADQLTEFIRRQADRKDVRLHCSMAGGRKTMGVLLASALQLFGREQDRLYHVLVPPEFESLDRFFFPPIHPRWLTGRDGRRLNTTQARIELAELPYVRLRGLLPAQPRRTLGSFSETVETANRRLRLLQDPEPVRLARRDGVVHIGDQLVKLSPAQMALYLALARTKLHHCARPELRTCGDCTDCYLSFTKSSWETTRQVLAERAGRPVLEEGSDERDIANQFRSLVSKLNHRLDSAVGLAGAENPYRVRSAGPKGETVYGLAIDKTKLTEE
ncbi:MAG: CRISPR-associated ring nuclease Csm6 [Nitrospira sp.]|nr:CRISPR-associated ring nuclease Csm6 [Nitrospira sp.]MCP9443543.1 CRISPR-associated ring nuclease Csm6 [Nitrospira sp.]